MSSFKAVRWLAVVLLLPSVAGCRSASKAHPVDLFGMQQRAAWYRDDLLNIGWTFYLRSAEDELFYIGINPRSVDASGHIRGLVYARLIRGAELSQSWSQTFAIDATSVSSSGREVQVGPNYFRLANEQEPHQLHIEIEFPAGNALLLDAEIRQELPTWHEGGVNLVHDVTRKLHLEYVMLCPRAQFSGTVRTGTGQRAIAGAAYFDSIRWLSAPLEQPLTWYWGFVQTGPYTLLVFEPHMQGTTGLFMLRRGTQDLFHIVQENWQQAQVLKDPMRLVYVLNHGSNSVRLEVDVSAFEPEQNQTRLAPFTIELNEGGRSHGDKGSMVFELGHWKRL